MDDTFREIYELKQIILSLQKEIDDFHSKQDKLEAKNRELENKISAIEYKLHNIG